LNKDIHERDTFSSELKRLGPTFVEIGHFLGSRPDQILEPYRNILLMLKCECTTIEPQVVSAVLEGNLDAQQLRMFQSFDVAPIARNTWTQDHVAEIDGGRRVRVRLVRPDAAEIIENDLKHEKLVEEILETTGALRFGIARHCVHEIRSWLFRQIDMEVSLRNLTRLYECERGEGGTRMPRPYPNLSGKAVLTMEYLEGYGLDEVIDSTDEKSISIRESVNCSQIARNVIIETLTQVLQFRFFQGNLCLSNLIAYGKESITYRDFGYCSGIDELEAHEALDCIEAIYKGEEKRLTHALLNLFSPNGKRDRLQNELISAIREVLRTPVDRDALRLGGVPVILLMNTVLQTVLRLNIKPSLQAVILFRTVMQAETVARCVWRELDSQKLVDETATSIQLAWALEGFRLPGIQKTFIGLLRLLRAGPQELHHILSQLSEGILEINVTTSEEERTSRAWQDRTRLLVAAIVSVGLAFLLGLQMPVIARWAVAVALVLLYLWIAIRWKMLK
jgi:ubiquinone biosynthesis protein